MANQKISARTLATPPLTGSEKIPIGVTGDKAITPDMLKDYILSEVPGFAKVERLAVQSIPDSVAPVAASWDTEHFDNAAIFSPGAPTRLTVPAGVGNFLVELTFQCYFVTNAVGVRRMFTYKNGAIFATSWNVGQSANALIAGGTFLSTAIKDVATGGDYYEIRLDQDSGGPVDAQIAGQIKITSL